MIESIARNWAESLKRQVPTHPASVAVLAYAFNFLLNTVITLLVTYILALILNQVFAVTVVLLSFAALRMVSGGYHFQSAMACILVSAVGANLIPLLIFPGFHSTGVTIVSLLLVLWLAPSRIEHQTRIPKKFFPFLKAISCGIIMLNFLFQSPIVAATFLLQSVTLLISFFIERRWKNT